MACETCAFDYIYFVGRKLANRNILLRGRFVDGYVAEELVDEKCVFLYVGFAGKACVHADERAWDMMASDWNMYPEIGY